MKQEARTNTPHTHTHAYTVYTLATQSSIEYISLKLPDGWRKEGRDEMYISLPAEIERDYLVYKHGAIWFFSCLYRLKQKIVRTHPILLLSSLISLWDLKGTGHTCPPGVVGITECSEGNQIPPEQKSQTYDPRA